MKLIDVQHPWFVPIYRRVLVVAVCVGWAVAELVWGEVFWAMLFGATGIYCAYQLFWAFDPKEPEERKKDG